MELQEKKERLQTRKKKIQPMMMGMQNLSPEELQARGIEGPAQLQVMVETGQLQDEIEEV